MTTTTRTTTRRSARTRGGPGVVATGVDEPLPDELPESIDPDDAADLARELAAPLRRATELLALLRRRAAERWSDDEA